MNTKLPPVPTAAPTAGSSGSTLGPENGGSSSTSANPAAGTSTRRNGSIRRRTTKYGTPHPGFKRDVAVLKASGMTTPAIARTLGVGMSALKYVQSLPDVKQKVHELREAWKALSQREVESMAGETWQMAKETVTRRDPKGFDYTMRGIAAMEKVSQSVSGEGQKVEVTGLPPSSPTVELKILVNQLLGLRGP